MASPADVENALKTIIVGALYPNGTAQPSAASGQPCAVMRGWPNKEELKADLVAGRNVISIWPRPGERDTTRHRRSWETLSQAVVTLQADVSLTTITLSGAISTPVNVAAIVNGVPYVHAVQPNDTLATIAAGLAALISEDTPASSVGAVLTVTNNAALGCVIGGSAVMIRELSRQEKQWNVIVWSPSPEARDVVAPFIDRVMKGAGLEQGRDRITLTDGSVAHLKPAGSGMPNDRAEVEGLFRYDLTFTVEFATTETQTAMQTVAGIVNITRCEE